jgi:hypothetical protein
MRRHARVQGGGNSKKLMLKSAEHVGEDLGKVFKAF